MEAKSRQTVGWLEIAVIDWIPAAVTVVQALTDLFQEAPDSLLWDTLTV
jgi:hypothetical protein